DGQRSAASLFDRSLRLVHRARSSRSLFVAPPRPLRFVGTVLAGGCMNCMRIDRRASLALLLVLASCGAEVAAPRDLGPSAQPSASGQLAPDAIYVRQSGNGQTALISVIDARTGAVLRALPNGVMSADRSTLYRSDLVNGASQTRVAAIDVATGGERSAITIDGALRTLTCIEGPAGLTPD